MSETNKTAFLEMFPCCAELSGLCGGLEGAYIESAVINREKKTLTAACRFAGKTDPAERHTLEGRIAAEYDLFSACLEEMAELPAPESKPEKKGEKKPEKKKNPPAPGKAVLGRPIKAAPVPLESVSLESGSVTVQGEIFDVQSRDIQKRGGWILSFEMTDNTSSIKVSKYFRAEDDVSALKELRAGQFVTVSGTVTFNRYEQDLCLEPKSITMARKRQREDNAENKRVELHLHTRFSAMDALTDPKAVVKRAAAWGHSAVAVTDHGVAQAFPEFWAEGKKAGIKIIYGMEGYYVNDVDDKLAVYGETDRTLTDEFVAFDIETTGLSAKTDRMTELGAVVFKNGEVVARFQTFVDPGMPIPRNITELTGITDRDVFGAPDEASALRDFIEFAGDRPLVAHNAEFDMGFMSAAAKRCGVEFEPVYMDTLTLAQGLLPDMRRFKLDLVAARLGLPEFNHHRASDDAVTCGKIMVRLCAMAREQGLSRFDQLNDFCRTRRAETHHNGRPRHIILLVKNRVGLKNLYELISKSHLEHFKKYPIIPKSMLLQHRQGLIIGSACEAGEVFDAVSRHRSDAELKRLCGLYDYLEIQPLCNNSFMIDEGKVRDEEELRSFNRRVVELGETLGKPVAATGDVHFLDPQQEIFRQILLAGRGFSDADRPLPLYLRTTEEMLEEFEYLGEEKAYEVVVTNTAAIADMCEEIELLPKGLFAPKIENSAEELKSLVYDKMCELYGETPDPIIASRVEEELYGDNPPDENGNIDESREAGGILGRGYDVIYMSAQKLVKDSNDHGYLVGSRGSVGSSLVAYFSGITEVNALPPHYRCPRCHYTDFASGKGYGCGADMPDNLCPKCGEKLSKDGFDIPFETFLGFGGDKVPDIDLNFSGEYQARAHKFTEELFGRDHVFKAGTIGTLAEKTAYGYVKNYLNEREKVVTKAEENRLTLGCTGVKRTTGQHPGGLVIIPQDMDVTDFCPVQHPADDQDSDIITTHFDYHKMEANLLKLDELGHDDPTMIKMLEDLTGVNAREIPLDDTDTRQIFLTPTVLGLPEDDPIIGHTGTLGIPEFGTPFTRQMLADTRPDKFDTLVRLSGFSHGTDVWAGNIRDIVVNGTADVNECVGCRDDIMLYLIGMGMEPHRAFTFMEAVRRGAIHKGKPWPEGIVEEMRGLGVPEWYIESCRKIQYLFPKAHAVAYVTMAFRIAYFKVHYPMAYYSCYFYRRSDSFDAALMTRGIEPVKQRINAIKNNPDATAKEQDMLVTLEVVYEFYMRGFEFGRIDLNRSEAMKYIIDGNTLIPPFVAVAGLGEAAARDLVACREGGRAFISIEEVMGACPKVSQTHIEQLKELGAFGDLAETSQMSLF